MTAHAYQGRRGPNVSQYLQSLNTVVDPAADESLGNDDDLSLFTNTLFVDSETGDYTDYTPHPLKVDGTVEPTATTAAAGAAASTAAKSPVDDAHSAAAPGLPEFNFFTDFSFPDFPDIPAMTFPDEIPAVPEPHAHQQLHQVPPYAAGLPQASPAKRKASESIGPAEPSEPADPSEPPSPEEDARRAAENDKRKRNTAASARFRVKKKMREQALEKSTKELTDKVTALEGRISQLETENKWLKNLVMEKNEGRDEIVSLLKNLDAAATAATSKSSSGAPG